MNEKKILKVVDQIKINASRNKVWEVLINPDFIKQWDDIPENYSGGFLRLNSEIEWVGHAKLTVTEFDELNCIKLNLYLPKVNLDSSKYDVSYKYTLSDNPETILHFEIGDFSPLPNPEDYYESTIEWLNTAKLKIKELSEV